LPFEVNHHLDYRDLEEGHVFVRVFLNDLHKTLWIFRNEPRHIHYVVLNLKNFINLNLLLFCFVYPCYPNGL
jgi:hypothetical protein